MFDGIYKEHLDGVYVSNGKFIFLSFFNVMLAIGCMPFCSFEWLIVLSSLICLGILILVKILILLNNLVLWYLRVYGIEVKFLFLEQ
jgi:hypothetical protein